MKKCIVLVMLALGFVSCQKNQDNDQVVSQRFLHKYGFDVSPDEWKERKQDGQVISMLQNGVTVINNYSGGVLHGNTTYTFPEKNILQYVYVYDQGSLVKKIIHDETGIPMKEELYEMENSKIITSWDKNGAPISIEEYENDQLIKGQYFTSNNELESTVEQGNGLRIIRNREGVLTTKDKMENGNLVLRTTFHPNGQVQSILPFFNYNLHGKQLTYSASGTLLTEQNWTNGTLDGMVTVYKNEKKSAEIPYIEGKKHGTEKRFDNEGNTLCEINWSNDLRHGSSRYYNGDDTSIDWFYNGNEVTLKRFNELEFHEKMISELRDEKNRISEQSIQ